MGWAQCHHKVDGARCGLAPNHEGDCKPSRKQCQARYGQKVSLQCQAMLDESVACSVHWAIDEDGATVRWNDLAAVYPAVDDNFLPRPELANPGRVQIVDCKATYPEPNGAFLRCDGRHNEEGHHGQDSQGGAGRINWTESVAVYPFNEGPVGNGSARLAQVGGEHYKKFKIQPWDVIDEYDLSFYAGNALKYLLRAGHKGSKIEDLRKARHYLDKMIELESGDG